MAPERNKGERLRKRRRARARLVLIATVLLILLAIAGIFYLLWQPYMRVSHVVVNDGDASIESLAQEELAGTLGHIVPRNSYFFVPEQAIRNLILKTHPELESVSISHPALTALAIKVSARTPLARWCGSMYVPQTASSTDCYLFDPTGFLYGLAASSTPLSDLLVFAPLTSSTTDVIGQTVTHATELPEVFRFSRQLGSLGAVVKTVVLRGDEVDLLVASSTRITYVLGDEQGAYTLAAAAFPGLNLSNGSIEYVDLRFTASGRVYLKRK